MLTSTGIQLAPPGREDSGLQLRWVLIAAVGFGALFRVWAVLTQEVPYDDGQYYMAMGATFAAGQGLVMPWELNPGPLYTPMPSHHFPPMWPLVLSGAYAAAGFSIESTMVTSLVVGIALIPVVFFTTRDLLGVEKAWFVTAFTSLYFVFIELTDFAYSENLLTIFYVLTIWAILRSLKDPRFIVLAGTFAGLGYLTKAAVGYFFLLAGAAGFLWRFYYLRWKVFTDRYYVSAIVIFLTCVFGWAARNLLAFGFPNWETSPYTTDALAYAFARPTEFVPVLAAKVFLFLVFYGTVALFFAPQLVRQLKKWREEAVSAHLLAIVLPAVLGVVFAAAFTLFEPWATLWWNENIRYVIMAFIPLLWLALREEPLPLRFRFPSMKGAARPLWFLAVRLSLVALAAFAFYQVDHMVGLILLVAAVLLPRFQAKAIHPIVVVGVIVVLGLTGINAATTIVRAPEYGAGKLLSDVASDGDVIAIVGLTGVYYLYPYLARMNLTLVKWNGSGTAGGASFVLSNRSLSLPGYRLLAIFLSTITPGWVDSAYIALSRAVRTALGLDIPSSTPPYADVFVYEALP